MATNVGTDALVPSRRALHETFFERSIRPGTHRGVRDSRSAIRSFAHTKSLNHQLGHGENQEKHHAAHLNSNCGDRGDLPCSFANRSKSIQGDEARLAAF